MAMNLIPFLMDSRRWMSDLIHSYYEFNEGTFIIEINVQGKRGRE